MDNLKEKTTRMLMSTPEVREILERALVLEEEGPLKYPGHPEYYLGWTWEDIGKAARTLNVLVDEGLLTIPYHSNNSRCYLIKDPDTMREALATAQDLLPINEIVTEELFNHIVGYDDVKYWLIKSIKTDNPVHILLAGPPASGKSLFLESLASLPGAQYTLGGSSTKAGIAEFLLYFHPRYLIIDELEKMNREDFSVLLSLMSSGLVVTMKKGMRQSQKMQVSVYAGVNRQELLPPELRSRFLPFHFTEYSFKEFIEIAVTVITHQLGKDPDLARYIAERVVFRTRDVRQAINLAKIVDSHEDVDRYEGARLL